MFNMLDCAHESTAVHSPHATIATGGGNAAQETPNNMMNDESELLEPGIVDFSAYG